MRAKGWGVEVGLIKSGKLRGPSNAEGAPQSGRSKVLLPENCITHCQWGNQAPPSLCKWKLQKQRTSGEIIRKSLPTTQKQHGCSPAIFHGRPPTLAVLRDKQHWDCAEKQTFLQTLSKSWKFGLPLLLPRSAWKIIFLNNLMLSIAIYLKALWLILQFIKSLKFYNTSERRLRLSVGERNNLADHTAGSWRQKGSKTLSCLRISSLMWSMSGFERTTYS